MAKSSRNLVVHRHAKPEFAKRSLQNPNVRLLIIPNVMVTSFSLVLTVKFSPNCVNPVIIVMPFWPNVWKTLVNQGLSYAAVCPSRHAITRANGNLRLVKTVKNVPTANVCLAVTNPRSFRAVY
jgi:hypothetical protein